MNDIENEIEEHGSASNGILFSFFFEQSSPENFLRPEPPNSQGWP